MIRSPADGEEVRDPRLATLTGDCDEPRCDGSAVGTGRMIYVALIRGWMVELACAKHGLLSKWRREYQPAVAVAVAEAGLDDTGLAMIEHRVLAQVCRLATLVTRAANVDEVLQALGKGLGPHLSRVSVVPVASHEKIRSLRATLTDEIPLTVGALSVGFGAQRVIARDAPDQPQRALFPGRELPQRCALVAGFSGHDSAPPGLAAPDNAIVVELEWLDRVAAVCATV